MPPRKRQPVTTAAGEVAVKIPKRKRGRTRDDDSNPPELTELTQFRKRRTRQNKGEPAKAPLSPSVKATVLIRHKPPGGKQATPAKPDEQAANTIREETPMTSLLTPPPQLAPRKYKGILQVKNTSSSPKAAGSPSAFPISLQVPFADMPDETMDAQCIDETSNALMPSECPVVVDPVDRPPGTATVAVRVRKRRGSRKSADKPAPLTKADQDKLDARIVELPKPVAFHLKRPTTPFVDSTVRSEMLSVMASLEDQLRGVEALISKAEIESAGHIAQHHDISDVFWLP